MDKSIYLAVFKENKGSFTAKIPEMDISVKGASIADAISTARDAIANRLFGEDKFIAQEKITRYECKDDEFAALIDIDLVKYRRAFDNRRVRKNLTIPGWLNEEAEKQDVNFSRVLEEAIKRKLNYND